MATKVLDLDLAATLGDIDGLAPYRSAFAVLRWRGKPIGTLTLAVRGGRISRVELWQQAYAWFGQRLQRHILEEWIGGEPDPSAPAVLPSCSVVICTRNRVEDLGRCLDSLVPLVANDVEVVVVDNAPSDDRTAELATRYPVRYTRELRKGLNWARSCGARTARHEIIAYTDDDVRVDRGWLDALRVPFRDPAVAAVTGLVMPAELESAAQEAFEKYAGFSKGFDRRLFHITTTPPLAAGNAGAGANMAFRRQLLVEQRLFEVEMDCGTATLSGGDHYALYRLLRAGHTIVYNPDALVWHRHRRTFPELRDTLYGYSVGVYCFFLRCLTDHGDWGTLRAGASWFVAHHLRQLRWSLARHPQAQPLDLSLAEIRGVLRSPLAFYKSRRRENAAARGRLAGAESTS